MPSSSSRKIVVRFNFWCDPAMEDRFAREPAIELRTCELRGPENDAWSELAEAHVYQISAARDELPQQWFATAELLERCPRLLCVSSTGAGYDTVDIAACTRAGVLVVNQAGANAQSVAEHTVALMLDVSRRISEGDRLLRRERGFAREDIMGHEMSGKVVGLVGIGHIGRRVAGLAGAFGMTVLAFDPYLTEEEIARRGAVSVTMSELLERSDFVSLHCPGTTARTR
jgi:D-3-phosphoglycerate dehydrogenase / 2-oxoglutarate reductase